MRAEWCWIPPIVLIGGMVWAACVVTPADLECRPCTPAQWCGADFSCVEGICRPPGQEVLKSCGQEHLPDASAGEQEGSETTGDRVE